VTKKNVAAYCRVSTDKEDQANSLESQRSYFQQYIENNPDWNLVEVYYDDGVSGTSTKNRDGFNRMIADAKNGKIDLILTKEISRFARNTVDTLSITKQLKEKGVGVLFTNDNINTLDSKEDMRLSFMSTIAQEESRKTSERVKWGQMRQMERGVVFGRDMLGYRVENGQLHIVPEEAEIVRLIFHKYLNEQKGTTTIAKELREAGITTIKGNLWSNTVLLRLLRNEKYVGDLCQKKTITTDYLTHKKQYNHGEEKMIYIREHHEPIIDRETWDATQRELERRKPKGTEHWEKHSNRYWCSGKLRCGECGLPMVSRKRKKHNWKGWMCTSKTRQGVSKLDENQQPVKCENLEVNEKVLKAAVREVLLLFQADSIEVADTIKQQITTIQNKTPKDEKQAIEKEIQKIQKKQIDAVDLKLEGLIDDEVLRRRQDEYKLELENLYKKLRTATTADEELKKQKEYMQHALNELNSILQYDVDSEALYGEVLEKIVIFKDKRLEVSLKDIPLKVQLRYETSGKLDGYKVDFYDIKILE